MNRYAIQDRMILQWQPGDKNMAKYALDAAQKNIDSNTVDQKWRWLTEDLTDLYDEKPLEAAACCSWCHGWIKGLESMLAQLRE